MAKPGFKSALFSMGLVIPSQLLAVTRSSCEGIQSPSARFGKNVKPCATWPSRTKSRAEGAVDRDITIMDDKGANKARHS